MFPGWMEKGEGSHLFLRPLASDSHLFDAGLPELHRYAVSFWESTSGYAVFSAFGLAVDTCYCQSTEWDVRVHSSSCGAHRGVFHSPLFSSFVATAIRVTSCSSSADCLLSGPWCCECVCVAMSCGRGFTPGGAYDSIWDSVMPLTGNFIYFQYQAFFGYVCMLNFWFSSNDTICAYNYFFPVQVEDMCRSVKWELYLYGDMTIKVHRGIV